MTVFSYCTACQQCVEARNHWDDWVEEFYDDGWGDGYDEVVDIDHVSAAEIHEPLTVELFCLERRPGGGVRCRRLRGHDGDHSAYKWHINQPETWS